MFAIIRCGGKQYRVTEGARLRLETGSLTPGKGEDGSFECADVLMLGGDSPQIGAPLVSGARVTFATIGEDRAAKIRVFKKKRRKQYRRTQGHRQNYHEVRCERILAG